MAGNKHHHVWQMLQRGFGEKRGKDHHIWVYQKGAVPERTVTRLFGVETHFYGPEGSDADTTITNFEGETQSTIQDIRALPNGAIVDTQFAATLITHLEMRSDFLRKEVAIKMQKAVGGLVESFRSPSKLREMLVVYLKENPEDLEKLLARNFVPINQRKGLEELAQHYVSMLPADEIRKMMDPILQQMDKAAELFPEFMKNGQNKAFAREAANSSRVELHLDREYSVLRPVAGAFILPDTTLCFIKKGSAAPFSQQKDVIDAVVLPVSSDVAIIGKSGKRLDYSLKVINRLLAGCAFNAFIAKEQNAHNESLANRIGKYATLLSGREMKDLLKD